MFTVINLAIAAVLILAGVTAWWVIPAAVGAGVLADVVRALRAEDLDAEDLAD